MGYFNFAIIAFLVLYVSVAINAELESTPKKIDREELFETEIKALLAIKQIEEGDILNSAGLRPCLPSGFRCNPNMIAPVCCSGSCNLAPGFMFRCG